MDVDMHKGVWWFQKHQKEKTSPQAEVCAPSASMKPQSKSIKWITKASVRLWRALFVSVHTLQKVRDAAADVELSHRLLVERLTAPKFYRGRKGKQHWGIWKEAKTRTERRAPSYWVSGAPWNFQQLPVTTNTHAHKYNLNGLYHLCKSFVLSQAEDLGICWRSWSNRRSAPRILPCSAPRTQKKSPRSSSRRPPKVTEVTSALLNMSRECGAAGETTDP